ncbi:MAG: hypothetical protein ACPIOQ_60220, partial [Promethearchaeia archaeon]
MLHAVRATCVEDYDHSYCASGSSSPRQHEPRRCSSRGAGDDDGTARPASNCTCLKPGDGVESQS